jgi:hypothetical protein
MPCEIRIGLKNSNKSLTKKTYITEDVTASLDNSIIDGLLGEAMQEFDEVPTKKSVMIRIVVDDD